MKVFKQLLLAFILIGVSGCYHAKVTTGLEPSAQVYEESFAASWIYGLVPPKTVEAAEECQNGVAMVDTELSFVNMLVGTITFGIYTPMSITVTCAASSAALQPDNSDTETYSVLTRTSPDFIADIQRASDEAVETGNPVFLKVR